MTGDIRRSRGQPPEECVAGPPRHGDRDGQAAEAASGDVETCLVDLTDVDLDVVAASDDSDFTMSLNLVLCAVDQAGTAVARFRPYDYRDDPNLC